MLGVLPPTFKRVLQQIKLLQVARILTSGYNYLVACEQVLCLGKNRPKACSRANYPVVTPYTSVLSLDAKQVCLGLVKSAKCTDFLAKKVLLAAFCNNFSQPGKT